MLMKPPQLLDHISHVFSSRPQSFAHQFLFSLIQLQKALNELAIDESIGAVNALPRFVAERSPRIEPTAWIVLINYFLQI